jgi:hypothetical protein
MSRVASGDTVIVKPSNNVYTVLAILGTIFSALAFFAVYMRANELGVKFW